MIIAHRGPLREAGKPRVNWKTAEAEKKTNEVTQAFFGMDLADAIAGMPSSFGGYQKIDTETFFR